LGTIVLDASVIINLNASRIADAVLAAWPGRVVIVEDTLLELREDIRSGRNDAAMVAGLIASGRLTRGTLNEAGLRLFESLVIGPAAETLDDGEAATIAFAAVAGASPVIDERKGRRIGQNRFPSLTFLNTTDLFAADAVQAAIGAAALGDAVFQALRDARMRVPPERLGWVVAAIGRDRARLCPSLPASVRDP